MLQDASANKPDPAFLPYRTPSKKRKDCTGDVRKYRWGGWALTLELRGARRAAEVQPAQRQLGHGAARRYPELQPPLRTMGNRRAEVGVQIQPAQRRLAVCRAGVAARVQPARGGVGVSEIVVKAKSKRERRDRTAGRSKTGACKSRHLESDRSEKNHRHPCLDRRALCCLVRRSKTWLPDGPRGFLRQPTCVMGCWPSPAPLIGQWFQGGRLV